MITLLKLLFFLLVCFNANSQEFNNAQQAFIDNLLKNPGSETGSVNFKAFQDAAGVMPVDGIGGTPTVLCQSLSTSPLNGNRSFVITKDLANRQGEGCSIDVTVPSGYATQLLNLTYLKSSSTSYVDGDLRMYAYDVTGGGAPIELNQRDVQAGNSDYIGAYQVPFGSVKMRLVFFIATTNSNAWTLKLDDIYHGKKATPRGPVVTDWKSYTPILVGFGTTSAQEFFWRANGDTLEVQGVWTNGTVTGSVASIPFPPGLTSVTTGQTVHNAGSFQNSNAASDNRMNLFVSSGGTGFGISRDGNMTPANGNAFNNGELNKIIGQAKILGWSSNLVLSEDGGQRDIVYFAGLSSNTSITSSANQFLSMSSVLVDTVGAASSGGFVAPESGLYDISAMVTMTSLTNELHTSKIFSSIKSAIGNNQGVNPVVDGFFAQPISSVRVSLTKGELIRLNVDSTADAAYTVNANNGIAGQFLTWLSIKKIASPQTLAGSETVAARAVNSSGTIFGTGSIIDVPWDSAKTYDTNGAFNPATGEFTASSSGLYEVNASLVFPSAAWTINQHQQLLLRKGAATLLARTYLSMMATGTYATRIQGTFTTRLSAGETIKLSTSHDRGGNISLATDSTYNFIEVIRTGN